MDKNIYIELTEQFNSGRLRTVICSGQAVVLHRLAVMSKDGDRIVREGRIRLESELDAERRELMRINENRLATYQRASEPWRKQWPVLMKEVAPLSLLEAHSHITEQAKELLPFQVTVVE